MNTLTLTVAAPAAIYAAGYTQLIVQKSSTQTAAGPYANTGSPIALDPTGVQTTYTFVDMQGSPADWYETTYYNPTTVQYSSPSAPEPGYLSDLCNNVRYLLGVDTTTLPDATVQGLAFLPAALAHTRQRISTFDTVVATGGNLAQLALAALAHYTAALLCPAMTVLIPDMLQFDKWRLQRNRQLDWTRTQQNLLTEYELLVSQANGELATTAAELAFILPQAVVMAGPTRGGIDTSGGLFPVVLPPDLSSGQPPYLNDQAPAEDFGTDG